MDIGDDELATLREELRDSPFLTTKQAAHYLGFTDRSLHAMRRKGRGPRFSRFGRVVRYHIRNLIAFAAPIGGPESADD